MPLFRWPPILSEIRELRAEVQALRSELKAQNKHLSQFGINKLLAARNYVDQGTQHLLAKEYRKAAEAGHIFPLSEVGFSNYSQFDEDGVLHYIFSLIGTTNKTLIEMCAGVGSECNSANLLINNGWNGLLFDGDLKKVEAGKAFFKRNANLITQTQIDYVPAWITKDNVNTLIEENFVRGEIDLFSLDLDGVDYWILEQLKAVSPRVLVVEANFSLGKDLSITVEYKDDFDAFHYAANKEDQSAGADNPQIPAQLKKIPLYLGASVKALSKLCGDKGYRLVGATSNAGPNLVFMRNGVGEEFFPAMTVDEVFANVPAALQRLNQNRWDMASGLPWVEV